MKTMSAALKAHYALGTTTLATCWKATLTNGAVIASTSLDQDLVIDAVTYLSASSYRASNVDSSSELNPDNLELDGFLASPQISDADIYSGLWDYAAIELFEVNYRDLTTGKNILRQGTLGQVKAGRSTFTAELRGVMQAYTRTIVRLTTKHCTAELGDERCTKALGPLTVVGTVDSVSANRVLFSAVRTEAANWFTGAKLTLTSGLNSGLSMEVKSSQLGSLTLQEAMPEVVAAGDIYSVYAGCTKRFVEDCQTKHNNVINFRGFPHLPGNAAYKYGGQ
jgi:uncharacterized phage protein (TIGR02218 family)